MKKFSAFLNEGSRSFAAKEAEKLNLSHVGYGKYADLKGNVTHISKDGKLFPMFSAQEMGRTQQNGGEETDGGEGKVDQGSISITFGRFNPLLLVTRNFLNRVAQEAETSGGEYRIYLLKVGGS